MFPTAEERKKWDETTDIFREAAEAVMKRFEKRMFGRENWNDGAEPEQMLAAIRELEQLHRENCGKKFNL